MDGLRYGIYPGGRAGETCAKPDDPGRIATLVDELAGGQPFLVREYVHFLPDRPAVVDALGAATEMDQLTMPDDWYLSGGRELDLVLSYLPAAADLPGWLRFIDQVLDRYGHLVRCLQVTLEPNFPIPLIDGSSPGVLDALTVGLPYARRRVADDVRVGFSVAEPPEWLGGDDAFWSFLTTIPYGEFAAHVDYVGLGLYPDAFGPVPPGVSGPLATQALRQLRTRIDPATPLHVSENGSPGGGARTLAEQATSLADMLAAVRACADELNVTAYELFSLRDADTAEGSPLGTLGLTDDSYAPKPAFAAYRAAIPRPERSP
ncbi:MAG: hypothetical protein ABW046_14640 [Actinoplanes sp.]